MMLMKKIVTGYINPSSDVILNDSHMGELESTDIRVWNKGILDGDVPCQMEITVQVKFLSEVKQKAMQKDGWTYFEKL